MVATIRWQGYEDGYFMGGCLFDKVTPDMDIYKQEIFGPVLSVVRTPDYEAALDLVVNNEYGNGAAIFTRDGDAARDFAARANIGMIGVNVPIPVPVAYPQLRWVEAVEVRQLQHLRHG